MDLRRLIWFCLLFVAVAASPLMAQDRSQPSSTTRLFDLLPSDSITQHTLKTRSGDLAYDARAGKIPLFDLNGTLTAEIFYTAYTASDGGRDRPLTFIFNGGPGAASAYLHLGLVEPRIVELGPRQNDGTTPALAYNPDSWLEFSDCSRQSEIRKRFADPLVLSMTEACKAGLGSTGWRYDCRRQNGRPIGRLEGEPRQPARGD